MLLGLLTACSPADQLKQQLRSATSAAQSVSMTLDTWLAGSAPTRYATDTVHAVGEILVDVETQIRTDASAQSDTQLAQLALSTVVKDLSTSVAHAEAGLRVGNRAEVQKAQRYLRAALRAMAVAHAKYFGPMP
ncbi:hypothetical protein [Mesorhizobium neociceri]|nr:hypothetical protein [Mesorhizobium neociceri]